MIVRAYADDLVLLSDDIVELEMALLMVFRFCEKRYLKVNKDKSEILQFRTGYVYENRMVK